jgi:hypothetical protein
VPTPDEPSPGLTRALVVALQGKAPLTHHGDSNEVEEGTGEEGTGEEGR